MEENSKKKEPQLREIKAPGGYRSNAASNATSGSWSGGMGTGPDDCMSYENYMFLCCNNALKSEVYVCGRGLLGSSDFNKDECGSFSGELPGIFPGSSGSSSSSSGEESSSSSSSSGNRGNQIISSNGLNIDWGDPFAWSGWEDFSGSIWDYSHSGLYTQEEKEGLLEEAAEKARDAYPGAYIGTRVCQYAETCEYETAYIGNEVVACDSFFEYDPDTQASILWHEFYHVGHGHYLIADRDYKMRTSRHVILKPEGDLARCLEKILEKGKISEEEFQKKWKKETELDVVHTSDWYDCEIMAYKAAQRNGLTKNERYLCMMRWRLWKASVLKMVDKEEMP